MNESTRAELEQLRKLHWELASQLNSLGRSIRELEKRLEQSAPAAEPPPLEITAMQPMPIPPVPVAAAPISEPPLIPKPPPPTLTTRPVVPPPIVPPIAPVPPVFAQTQVSPTPEPIVPQAQNVPPAAPPPTLASVRVRVHPQEPAFDANQTSSAAADEPAPTAPAAKKESFEMRLGTFWLVRVGIVVILTGFVLCGMYAYKNYVPRLGKGGKVALLYLASAALLGVGAWLLRRQEKMKNYAQILVAGGLAAVYFTTYAAHFIPNLKVIENTLLAGGLLLGWACFIIWLADRAKSETLALFAILLAYYTSIITNVGLFTLYSNLVLTLAAVFFLVRNRWATVSFASLAATYAGYAFWRFYFQHGEWQWAAPTEGLSTGVYFLVCYWVVFTAALFISNHEQFAGPRRASFLSLNNGAFFSCFLLTMLQVHQGGFWKFSLIYGGVQLALTGLAWQFRREDKLFRNTFLTQGLLLVTLGFITYFAGFKLSLVLGVESVILLVLGRQLQNRVMQFAAYAAAVLAVGWCVPNIPEFDQTGLRTGIAVGTLMLINAFQFRKATGYDRSVNHPQTVYFTLLALALWLETTWQNTSPLWRGLTFAVEGSIFLVAARPLGNRMLELGSFFFSFLAVTLQTAELAHQFESAALAQRTGLLPGALVGILMLVNALIQRRLSPQQSAAKGDRGAGFACPPVTLLCGLALLMAMEVTCVFTPTEYLAPLLALEALVFTASFYVLRLAEMPLFGQAFLLLAQGLWLAGTESGQPDHPWWNPISVIAITLGISHWWQRQGALKLRHEIRTVIQLLYALAIVGVLFFWVQPKFAGPHWLMLVSVFAVALTIYGIATRFWLLAAAGQLFLVVAGWEFARELLEGGSAWYFPLIPVAALLLLALGTVQWFQRRPEANPKIAQPLLAISLAYRVVALVMSLWWVYKYIPPREQCWVLALIGLGLFALAGARRSREALIFGAIFTGSALARFWAPDSDVVAVYWPNLIALLLLPLQERLTKRWPDRYVTPQPANIAAMVLGALSVWLYLSRWVGPKAEGIYLTAAWSVLALVLFIAGMVLRERIYRWFGLGVLACALGRVIIFDIWKLETIFRILSFMAIGVVLLVLGFIYNKYQERIKEWL